MKSPRLDFHPRYRGVLHALTALVVVCFPLWLNAQIAVTSVTTSTSDLSNTTVDGTTFERTTTSITTFYDAAGNVYDANTVASSAFVRRNPASGTTDNSSVWYDQGSSSTRFSATYATSYSSLLLGNNILRGSDNTFANGTGVSEGDIERIDFLFSASGITADASTSFAIFDRGDIGAHDFVQIAVITGWNSGTNTATAYGGNIGTIETSDYGSTNVVSSFTYNLFRYSNGNNLGGPDYWDSNTETGTQGIGGVVISMADLGIAAGTTIYGYSLFGYDVSNGGSMSNLVDWTNATYYPTNTTGTTGTGGIDLSAVNGVLYNRRVPEPSTYGAIAIGGCLLLMALRRRAKKTPLTARVA